jgi:hypothetical protein
MTSEERLENISCNLDINITGILFYTEFYNLANHANFTSPRTDSMTSGTSVALPRRTIRGLAIRVEVFQF